MNRPDVSLCMIVRDGGDSLRCCLASVAGLVDEIVVVDTGSSDGSVAVAREAGARVLEIPWEDDFSAARNVGLEVARGEWILVLDADEELSVRDRRLWASLLRDSRRLAYFFPVVSELEGGDVQEVAIPRLFRNRPEVRFRYPIHEQVVEDLNRWSRSSGLRFGHVPEIRILHQGYRERERVERGKSERNLRILRKAVVQFPRQPYLWYKLAEELRGGDPPATLEASTRGIELCGQMEAEERPTFFPELLAIHITALLGADRLAEARGCIDRYSPDDFRSSSYWFIAATVALAVGDLQRAECWSVALTEEEPSAWLPAHGLVRNSRGWLLRAQVSAARGSWEEAVDGAKKALSLPAPPTEACALLSHCLQKQGKFGPAVHALTSGIRSFSIDRCQSLRLQLGVLLGVLGKDEEAERVLRSCSLPGASLARGLLARDFSKMQHPDGDLLWAACRGEGTPQAPSSALGRSLLPLAQALASRDAQKLATSPRTLKRSAVLPHE